MRISDWSSDVCSSDLSQLPLDQQAERRAVGDRQQPAVERPGEDRLRVERIDQIAAFVIIGIADAVGVAKYDVARSAQQPRRRQHAAQLPPGPFAAPPPPLDAIVAVSLAAPRPR